MAEKKRDCWLSGTGQLWKLRLASVLAVLGVSLPVLMRIGIFVRLGTDDFQLADSFILFLGLAAFILLFFSIKCPACKGRPVYRIARTYGADEWLFVVLTFEHCPVCGYPGNSEKEKNRPGHPEQGEG